MLVLSLILEGVISNVNKPKHISPNTFMHTSSIKDDIYVNKVESGDNLAYLFTKSLSMQHLRNSSIGMRLKNLYITEN